MMLYILHASVRILLRNNSPLSNTRVLESTQRGILACFPSLFPWGLNPKRFGVRSYYLRGSMTITQLSCQYRDQMSVVVCMWGRSPFSSLSVLGLRYSQNHPTELCVLPDFLVVSRRMQGVYFMLSPITHSLIFLAQSILFLHWIL